MAALSKLIALAFVASLFAAAPALAYQESTTTPDPSGTPAFACPSCHGLEADTTSPTVAPSPSGSGTRKGPHGGYTIGTQKCNTCHSIHAASVDGNALLPRATIVDTCNTCHDGTGGGGVYGVVLRRTGEEPSGHRIEESTDGKIAVPGGDPAGGSIERTFSGESGGLTCIDCHSPHDAGTVEPFVGDRKRSVEDTTAAIATNRLLWKRPTSGETTVAAYGSDWCLSCHKGSSRGTMTHPVGTLQSSPAVDYMNVKRLSAYDTTTMAGSLGALGGTNLGYVVPPGSGALPICQQCHEDSRSVANDMDNPLSVDGTTELFSAPVDGASGGNPTFQNFPHEAVNPKMLVETRDSLCLNCHDVDSGGNVH